MRPAAVLEPPVKTSGWKLVEVSMRRNGYSGDALIETLHTVQDCFGYLDNAALAYVARSLRLPPSKVYGVATFYHIFTLKPQGKHTCVVCTGTACYIKGATELLDGIKSRYAIRPGQTTTDATLSLLDARCLGACGLAPAAVIDGKVMGNQSAAGLLEEIAKVV
ncbi:MAG: bidirectional hydrogenase complex protein HoxE [Pirellulales bacterium]